MNVLGYLAKLKRGLGLIFGAYFLHDFFHKNVPYLILYQWPKFQCHMLFLSQNIIQNMLLSSYLDKWWWFFLNHPLKPWLTGKKERKIKLQKFEYLENEKSFLDEIKNIFPSFWRAIIRWKIKILWKIADTSFKSIFPQIYHLINSFLAKELYDSKSFIQAQ